jgi:hypothetical protein
MLINTVFTKEMNMLPLKSKIAIPCTSPMRNEKMTCRQKVIDMYYPRGEEFTISDYSTNTYRVMDKDGREGLWDKDGIASVFADEEIFLLVMG